MLIDGQFPVAAPPHALLAHLFDARLMASCLPGCETLEPLDDDRYRAVVVIAMAGIKARFDLQVEVTRRDATQIWAVTRGEEGGRASTLQADSQVSLEPSADGTLVRYRSEVAVTGRLGRFALGMMKKKAQTLGDEFAANLQRRLVEVGSTGMAHGEATPEPAPREAVLTTRETSTPSAETPARPASAGETSNAPPSMRAPQPLSNASARGAASPAMTRASVPGRSWLRMLLDWLRGLGARRPARSPKAGD